MAPIETYIVINIVMNFAIIGIVARIRGRVVWQRVAFASGFGCVYAIAMESGWFPQLNYLVFKVALAVVITLVAVKADGIWSLVSGTLMLLGATVFVGGVVSMSVRIFGQNTVSMLAGAIAGLVSLLAATEFRTRRLDRWEAQVKIVYVGKTAGISAMIDTGNRLREPLSGLPVLIVEYRAINHMLPATLNVSKPCESLPAGYRLARFDSLGSMGEMALFRPDELWVSYGDGWVSVEDVWIGVYDGVIPGQYSAIAPVVLGCIRGRTGKIKNIYIEGSGGKWKIPHIRQ